MSEAEPERTPIDILAENTKIKLTDGNSISFFICILFHFLLFLFFIHFVFIHLLFFCLYWGIIGLGFILNLYFVSCLVSLF